MPFEDREKFVEDGTGQVFYLWEESGTWVIARFAGGPDPLPIVARFGKREEAIAALKESDYQPMPGEN